MKITRLIESYTFRRWVCELPENARHPALLDLIKKINANELAEEGYCRSAASYFCALDDARLFPKDVEFEEALRNKRIYNEGRRVNYCKYMLDRLTNHGSKERVEIDEKITIEHVMPQNLTEEWESYLGDDFQDIHEKHLHKLGNLTLTGYNPTYSNKLFLEKRNMKDGFKDSPIWLNRDLSNIERWDEKAMEERGKGLAKKAVEIWVSAESLAGRKK